LIQAALSVDGSAVTELVGGVTSIVFSHVGVAIGALASNTTVAVFEICVPVSIPLLRITLNNHAA
jgi:hypothetical protein